jgi:hypothetical protein
MKVPNSLRTAADCRRKPLSPNPRVRRFDVETLERRELLAATAFISEIHPTGSGNGTYAADWFEVTNTGATLPGRNPLHNSSFFWLRTNWPVNWRGFLP